jgi:hypothetical protein
VSGPHSDSEKSRETDKLPPEPGTVAWQDRTDPTSNESEWDLLAALDTGQNYQTAHHGETRYHKSKTHRDLGASQNAATYDLDSLPKTVTWLQDASSFLSRQAAAMADIHELVGRDARTSSFGTFPNGQALWRKHQALHTTVHAELVAIAKQLTQVAIATDHVRKEFARADGRNDASAKDIQKALGEGQPSPPSPSAGDSGDHPNRSF